MKIVVDTNVIFSGIFFRSVPSKILDNVLNNAYQLVLSEPIVSEYRAVIARYMEPIVSEYRAVIARYMEKKHTHDIYKALEIIDMLVPQSFFIDPIDIITPYCADPDDVKFLEVAIAAKAKYLISGDKHLLNVGKYPHGIVLNAAKFLEQAG